MTNGMKTGDWTIAGGAMCLVAVILLMLTWDFSPWSTWDFTSPIAASWVQAIGSIGAILGAVGVMLCQHQLQMRREALTAAADELKSVSAIAGLLRLAAAILNVANDAMTEESSAIEYYFKHYGEQDFYSLSEILQEMKFESVKQPSLMLALHKGRKAYKDGVSAIEYLRGISEFNRHIQVSFLAEATNDVGEALAAYEHRIHELTYHNNL